MTIKLGPISIQPTGERKKCSGCGETRSATFYIIRFGIYGHALCPFCKGNLREVLEKLDPPDCY